MSTQLSPQASSQAAARVPRWEESELPRWRRHPERLAWAVLLISFATFAILAVAIPWSIRYTVRYAMVSQDGRLDPTRGTVLLYPPRAEEPIAITEPRDDISEGSRIVLSDGATQAVFGVAEMPDSDVLMGSVHLYSGTSMEVLRIRRPRFAASTEPYHVRLRLDEGRARVFTNSPDQRALLIEIETPHGTATLGEGSYNFSVTPERTEVTVRSGVAELYHPSSGQTVVVESGLRTWVGADQPPQTPVSAEQDLIRNGTFSEPLLDTWEIYTQAQDVTPGTVEIVEQDGRRVARFLRQGEENVHTEVGIRQRIDKDVNVHDFLSVRLDVKLIRQSLPGAGYLSSEYPLRVEISYTDIYGKDLTWGHGFYYREPEPGWPIIGGERIPPFVWYSYESPNLMAELAETRPARINSIRIYASGWNYESMASEISLVAR